MLSRINTVANNSTRTLKNIRSKFTKPIPLISGKRVNEVTQKRNILFKMKNETPSRITGYYLIFPAIPDENKENNRYLASIENHEDWPAIQSATPREMYQGTVRMVMEYGATVYNHLEHLEKLFNVDPDAATNYDTIIEPILSQEYDMEYAFHTLLFKMLTDWPECSDKDFDSDMHHLKILVAKEKLEKLTSPAFNDALRNIYKNQIIDTEKDDKNKWIMKLIEYYLLEERAIGYDKTEEKTRKLLGSWSKFIDEYRAKYIANIMATHEQVRFNITNKDVLKDAPPHVLRALAVDKKDFENGPWTARLCPTSIMPFMEYCRDRALRAEAWEKWTSRASFEHDFYNNSINIEELRHNNDGLAKTLGYTSVSQHRLTNKMAGSPAIVRKFLTELTKRIRPVFLDRLDAWQEYAQKKEMIANKLAAHDLFYICRKEAFDHYGVNDLELMNYFPFWETFDNITKIAGHLLNINFVEVTDNLEKCHPSVKIFNVIDVSGNKDLGRLYIDPFDRENKRGGWLTILGRMANEEKNLDKIVFMVCRANEPDAENNSYLHYTQLKKLLFNIGRSIQLLLSQSPYRDIAIPWAPMYAADWDAADLLPTFFEFFIYKPNLLKAISSPHAKTGERLPEELANNGSLSFSRATLWETYRTLFWSDFDLTIFEMENRKDKFWVDLYREMYKEYFPFKMNKNDYHPCSFTPIFAMQPFMSMYYRKLWKEMLALDVHETFAREQEERSTGERLKQTILYPGSQEPQEQLYRRFQGRDPSVGAICNFYDPPVMCDL
uniref:Neurolysin, mitochondrial (inferred by orthology to a human protein) n=1 Tax=Strongyloides venezuelensis TaxID=75913 RepID=A0A0K0FXI9_STRVS